MTTINCSGQRVLVAVKTGAQDLASVLRGDGWAVDVADSGWEAAFALWPSLREDLPVSPPDLLIVSALLPGYTGLSLLGDLRALGWKIPVLVTIAPEAGWARREAFVAGADGIFDEPVDVAVIREAIREWQTIALPTDLRTLSTAPRRPVRAVRRGGSALS